MTSLLYTIDTMSDAQASWAICIVLGFSTVACFWRKL